MTFYSSITIILRGFRIAKPFNIVSEPMISVNKTVIPVDVAYINENRLFVHARIEISKRPLPVVSSAETADKWNEFKTVQIFLQKSYYEKVIA